MRCLVGRALLGLCLCSPAAAQTSDPIFARWRFNPDSIGSRPAGLDGVFVGIADSNKAAYANPAGLTLIPVREVGLSTGGLWIGGAAGSRHVRMAAYVTKTSDSRQQWSDADPRGAASGSLDASVWEAGVAAGVQPLRRVRLGASIAWSRLSVEGRELRSPVDEGGQTTVTAHSGRLRLAGGVLFDIVGTQQSLPSAKLGISYQPGFDWSADVRRGAEPSAPSDSVELRRPALVAAGLAWRPNDRWSFSAQGDFIRYREVVAALRRNDADRADGFGLPDTVEPRVGTELAAPLWCGCGIVKLRAGLHYRSPGVLRYGGTDPLLARAFTPEQWRTVVAVGGSFFAEYLGNAVRLDLDSKDLFEGPELSFGIVWRF